MYQHTDEAKINSTRELLGCVWFSGYPRMARDSHSLGGYQVFGSTERRDGQGYGQPRFPVCCQNEAERVRENLVGIANHPHASLASPWNVFFAPVTSLPLYGLFPWLSQRRRLCATVAAHQRRGWWLPPGLGAADPDGAGRRGRPRREAAKPAVARRRGRQGRAGRRSHPWHAGWAADRPKSTARKTKGTRGGGASLMMHVRYPGVGRQLNVAL